ncbi:tryptophan synthase alpha chain [Chryseobacterium sp. SORGH_AS1175]|nr:tryptophan synthase alpha chain [Chryseobacterium sp. SORGH_AS_1175]
MKSVKDDITIPVILMGYINPVLSFGFERFCAACAESGVSGLIIPDLPPVEFEKNYGPVIRKYGLNFTFLVTPETSSERILYLDSLSSGFLYAVSSSSTTGSQKAAVNNEDYLSKLASLPLTNPLMIGFGIQSRQDFERVTKYADGGIIGTAFVNILLHETEWKEKATRFIRSVKA